jgi:peroxiredoxin
MLPHERSLVNKLQSKPFVLLGVNSDTDKAKYKELLAKESVTWPNFFDGNAPGPIATAWKIREWPTVYVIDAKGVIRHKGVQDDALDKAVEALIAEAEAAPPK